jgi:hypothetical protein
VKYPIWIELSVSSVKSVAKPEPKSIVAPYITKWSAEVDPPASVIDVGGGIGYADEKPNDRDQHGVLWARASRHPGEGRPLFAQVHPLRQRRAMRMLLCSVCGGPADRDEDGVLWLLTDHRDDWPGWPSRMAAIEPPVCRPVNLARTLQDCTLIEVGDISADRTDRASGRRTSRRRRRHEQARGRAEGF